jgi:hypothetical protein
MYFLEAYPETQLNLISAYHPELPNVKVTPALKIWRKPISLTELEKYLKEELQMVGNIKAQFQLWPFSLGNLKFI